MSSSADSADADAPRAPRAPRALAPAGEPLRVVCGPTAAGKSAVALALAERFHGAIVSADSRQIYRGFDVGTAKPDATEQRRVPHYGLDVAAPGERWSAARWAADAGRWIADARARGRMPVIVGGTGFYVRALLEPLFVEPALDAARRERLAAFLDRLTVPELRRWTLALDPARAQLGRTQLLRAVETALLTGQRISALHAASAGAAPALAARYLVVDPGRTELLRRIERRVDAMLAGGWVEEVRRLAEVVPPDAPAWNASGYSAVARHVAGEIGLDEARTAVVIATRQYAKRQRTWIRHQLAGQDVTMLDPREPDALERAAAWWAGTPLPRRPLETLS